LRGVDVDFPKRALTVVTGVSGSGKSSLVHAVLEAEAKRRYLESLSMYERQGVREGPEAPVDSVSGLGVAVTIGPPRRVYDRRATLGTATEISHHLAALLAAAGERNCPSCGAPMRRTAPLHRAAAWLCPSCGATAAAAEPRHFSPHTYAAACLKCHGIGTLQGPNPDKLIVRPDLPLCGGAMHSPGFFPKGYLCKPFNGGYDEVQALAERYSFDPCRTPWNRMAPEAQRAFLFGDPRPLPVTFRSRTGRVRTSTVQFRGFYGWIGDWDTGGTYTDTLPCPDCGGSRLRPEFLAVTLAGRNIDALSRMTLDELGAAMREVVLPPDQARLLGPSLETVRRRTHFLRRVGLGYAHLNRLTETLSAGEAQRARLAGLLGSRLTSLTVLVDEPTRGLHPAEVDALVSALADLRDEGNTVIAVEHDPQVMRAADIIVDLGPGAGAQGGRIVARGAPAEVARADTMTGAWLRGERRLDYVRPRREPRGWLTVRGARANNLRGGTVSLPLGTLTGVCGVSGSGKSTLMIDTLGRALAPAKHTTSVAREPIEPGAHDGIDGAPPRVILLDQSRAGLHSPASFLELDEPLRALYAAGEDARALGLDERSLARACAACHGSGVIAIDMGFLPDATTPCEVCRGTGCLPEAWEARLNGLALPEAYGMTLDQAFELFGAEDAIRRPLQAAREAGLGYLVLRQPGHALSGGEAQRLKMARELSRPAREETLYLLDEPTVGQHLEDVARLVGALRRLVDAGHTVYVVEHHAHLLAACDWLVELGPGGGPDGGLVVAAGTPEAVARGNTATAPYLRALLEAPR
jgi:excinuclease ABC subunit A